MQSTSGVIASTFPRDRTILPFLKDAEMTGPGQLYDEDFLAWTHDQAEVLRHGVGGNGSGTHRTFDWGHLAEEIESLGKAQRLALASQVRRILHHLLKLEHSPATEPRNGWRASIREARAAIRDLLTSSPSLRPDVDEVVAAQRPEAVRLALGDLADHGELGEDVSARLQARQYDAGSEILSDWLPNLPSE